MISIKDFFKRNSATQTTDEGADTTAPVIAMADSIIMETDTETEDEGECLVLVEPFTFTDEYSAYF